jgi:NUMOD3 motif
MVYVKLVFRLSIKKPGLKLRTIMRIYSAPWNKGLTKETDKRVHGRKPAGFGKKISKVLKGRVPWNKGLTKETDERLNNPKLQGKSHPWYGKHHLQETKEKIAETLKRPNPQHSKWMAEYITKNNGINLFNKTHKQGKFYSRKNRCELYYASSWELQAYYILEQMSEVIAYSRCNFYIEYKWKDSIHHYIPDIKVTYKSGNVDIIEIKPINMYLKNRQIQVKARVAGTYCQRNNMNYVIWTGKFLKNNLSC